MSPTTVRRIALVSVTTDLDRALRHYDRLGFTVGYASRDGVELHVAKVDRIDPGSTTSCAYLWVDDATVLFQEWSAAGVAGRLQASSRIDDGLDEGAYVDPDGNLIRFGSPAPPPRADR